MVNTIRINKGRLELPTFKTINPLMVAGQNTYGSDIGKSTKTHFCGTFLCRIIFC